ncbi:formate dehydrogenase subunit alpha [Limnobacter humi]|uniref:Formate dehydrogenase subunit alpha n=1 Tax=Limnobacter humi TaxID=1778671 RepID=A0ABT1WDZ7_9BURK|nr:formate dehydrogenase subunit alpha [Limnobacter humi]MCQ8895604.1 formate dehydrogenase subunit alpha [Limnobacter humi]
MKPMAPISFQLNGQTIQAQAGETILDAALRHHIHIPHVCHSPNLTPAGNCRACVVEVDGERALTASCCRLVEHGMVVHSNHGRALTAQRLVMELLDTDQGQVGQRFPVRPQHAVDTSHPAFTLDLNACIQCTRCIRACRDEQVNDVLGMGWRGAHAQVVFDQNDPVSQSTCVGCGECVQVCPTGALKNRSEANQPDIQAHTVSSVCPYCGVGCQVELHVSNNQVLEVTGKAGPANQGRLCIKGRYGFDYIHHPQRLTTPLIRKSQAPKHAHPLLPAERWMDEFRPATWDEALQLAADRLTAIKRRQGAQSLAGFGSAKCTNEEAYLFQKLVRTGFGSNNVDHCTRLCHASSVSALLEGVGSGAVSNPVRDVAQAEVILVIGANPSVNHPVGASWIKNAVKQGATLIVADPRRTDLARHARHVLQFKPDTDVLLLNAMLHVIVQENLVDHTFIADRVEGFDELAAHVNAYSPERVAPLCGIPADLVRTVARTYARAKSSMILWGMGISQHVHGTDNARCLIALAMITGQIGRPGTGLHPLRGQNNVQGASDAGLIPMMYPDYQRVDHPDARAKFETLWNTRLDPKPGLTVVEVMQACLQGQVQGMYIVGENPAMSDPDVQHARDALAALDCLIVQDIFLTETASLADIVLPATAFYEKTGTVTNTDRLVQMGRKAVDPPGEAKPDWWIIQALAQRMGLPWRYPHEAAVFDEMRHAMHSLENITWDQLEQQGSQVYPCNAAHPLGQSVVFTDQFPTATGKARLVPAHFNHAGELPDADYPFVLITGRQLEHWHTGSMTRRSAVLDELEPQPYACLNPEDLRMLDVAVGQRIEILSRRGQVQLPVRADAGNPRGTVFIPFCYHEAAANVLTNPQLDPVGKIPEFKFCAIAVHKFPG